jgi:hypothetical protein
MSYVTSVLYDVVGQTYNVVGWQRQESRCRRSHDVRRTSQYIQVYTNMSQVVRFPDVRKQRVEESRAWGAATCQRRSERPPARNNIRVTVMAGIMMSELL